MKTKLIWANLASANIERTAAFYTALGFKAHNSAGPEQFTSIKFGEYNFVINFFSIERLQQEANGKLAPTGNGQEVIFSLSAENRGEVDAWAIMVTKAGGSLVAQPQNYDKGYVCSFADPDGHKFNVLYWPGM